MGRISRAEQSAGLPFRLAAGRVFLRAREAAGLNQEQAAKRLLMSPANLARIELGYQPIGFAQLWLMADLYGVPASELVRRLEQLWHARDLLGEVAG